MHLKLQFIYILIINVKVQFNPYLGYYKTFVPFLGYCSRKPIELFLPITDNEIVDAPKNYLLCRFYFEEINEILQIKDTKYERMCYYDDLINKNLSPKNNNGSLHVNQFIMID